MRPRRPIIVAALFAAIGAAGAGGAAAIDESRLVDLTYSYDDRTIYWPTAEPFRWEKEAWGRTEAGYWYSAGRYAGSEHGGTHLDAPIHFFEGGLTAERIPLEQLMAPAVVIDISEKAAADRDARLSVDDVTAFEKAHGTIPRGAMVLLRTGWDRYWGDRMAYFGDTTPNDASKLHFPSYGVEAAKLLIEERGVGVLGVDTPSIDYGPSAGFEVHRVLGAKNGVGLENLRSLDQLPPTGALVVALPMKIEKGSGGPVRVVGLVPR